MQKIKLGFLAILVSLLTVTACGDDKKSSKTAQEASQTPKEESKKGQENTPKEEKDTPKDKENTPKEVSGQISACSVEFADIASSAEGAGEESIISQADPEEFQWAYDAEKKEFSILHKHNCLDCEGWDMAIKMAKTADNIVVTESLSNSTGNGTYCHCNYDFKATIDEVDSGNIKLKIVQDLQAESHPNNGSHVIFDDTIDLSIGSDRVPFAQENLPSSFLGFACEVY